MRDVLIVGGGAAAWSAGLFAARRGLKTLVLCKDVGGQMLMTNSIQNYPGIDAISGGELAVRFQRQAIRFGVEIGQGEGVSLTKQKKQFAVTLSNGEVLRTASVILAFGLTPRDLGVDGEERYRGKGVFSSGALSQDTFRGKRVAVIGGGNSAIEEALFLSQTAKHVFIIHRREVFRGDECSLRHLRAKGNVKFLINTSVKGVQGDEVLRALILSTQKNAGGVMERTLPLDGVFVHIGFEPRVDWVRDFVEVDSKNLILVDRDCHTKTAGLFAAGDVTTVPYKQIVVAAAEGCKAAFSAYRYVKHMEDATLPPDWS